MGYEVNCPHCHHLNYFSCCALLCCIPSYGIRPCTKCGAKIIIPR